MQSETREHKRLFDKNLEPIVCYTKIAIDLFVFVWAVFVFGFAMSAYETKDLAHRQFPTRFNVFQLKPHFDPAAIDAWWDARVKGVNFGQRWRNTTAMALFLSQMRDEIGCNAAGAGETMPSYCTKCAGTYGESVYKYALAENKVMDDSNATVARELRIRHEQLKACVFREGKHWEARLYAFMNPWISLVLWTGFVTVSTVLTHGLTCTSPESGGMRYAIYALSIVLFLFTVFYPVWATAVGPNATRAPRTLNGVALSDAARANDSWKYDLLHVFLPAVALMAGPLFHWVSEMTGADQGHRAMFRKSIPELARVAMFDYTLLLCAVPMINIFCAFRSWTDITVLLTTAFVVVFMFLVALFDDTILAAWNHHSKGGSNAAADRSFYGMHSLLVVTAMFVFAAAFAFNYPHAMQSDPYNSFWFSLIFFIVVAAIVFAPTVMTSFASTNIDTLTWIKETIELVFRFAAVFWLMSVYNMKQYDE